MQTYLDNLLASMLEENKRLATCVTTMKSLVDEAKIDCQINNTENSDNMKHNTEQKPEALQLAEKLRDAISLIECDFSDGIATNDLSLAAMELESLHARVQELERQPEAVRAGGDSTDEVTVLPDGSAFAVYSYPLPKDHWLYAPREYEQGAEEPKELAAPILTHASREQVISAIRYAIRGATDCGKETNFDPDALVQNAVYALCGPFNKNQPHPKTDALDAECFRFWVSEAARSPAAMAKLIMHCTTEDEYRAAITQCIDARKAAIAAAKENK